MRTLLAAGIVGLVGCGAANLCEDGECDCIESRRLASGVCCPGFTRPDAGVCVARSWTLPGPADVWGEPGAVDLEVAVDSEGQGVAGWVAAGGGQVARTVVVAEEVDSGWALQSPAASLEGFGTRPSLAAGPGAEVLVSWKQQLPDDPTATAPNDVSYVSRRGTDGQWKHPGAADPLSLPPSGHEPRPLIAPWGEALIVWNQWMSPGYGVALAKRSADDPDGPLTGPVDAADVLSPPVNFSNTPQIAFGPNGDALVVWYQAPEPQGDLMVYAAERYRIDGEFNRPRKDSFISPTGAPADAHRVRNPVPAVGDRGHAAVVWAQENGMGDIPIFIATRDGRRTWTVPLNLYDTFSPANGRATCAQVVFGRGTELFVIWYQDLGEGAQVFAAHRNSGGEWDAPGMFPDTLSTPGYIGIDPWIARGPDGEVVAVWVESDGTNWRVASRRRNPDATRWSELDVLSPADGNDPQQPVVAVGSTGRVIAAWRQGPPGLEQIRFAAMD